RRHATPDVERRLAEHVDEPVASALARPKVRERLPAFPERPADPLEPERFERGTDPPERCPPARFEPRYEVLKDVPLLGWDLLDRRRLEPPPDADHARDGVAARQFDQIALDGPDAERLAFGCLRTLRRPEHLADVAE